MLKSAPVAPTLVMLDSIALLVLGSVIKPELRETAEGVALAYEIAREMLKVREGYEEVAQAQQPQTCAAPADCESREAQTPSLAESIHQQAAEFAHLVANGKFPLSPREQGEFHLIPHAWDALERVNQVHIELARLRKVADEALASLHRIETLAKQQAEHYDKIIAAQEKEIKLGHHVAATMEKQFLDVVKALGAYRTRPNGSLVEDIQDLVEKAEAVNHNQDKVGFTQEEFRSMQDKYYKLATEQSKIEQQLFEVERALGIFRDKERSLVEDIKHVVSVAQGHTRVVIDVPFAQAEEMMVRRLGDELRASDFASHSRVTLK